MSSLESNKNLAGIGALLLILGFVPAAGVVVGIIGVILLLVGIKGIANYYQDNEIYHNAVTGIIFYVIALVAAAVAIVGLIFGGIFGGLSAGLVGVGIGLAIFVGALIIAFIFYVLAAMHLRRTFSTLATKSGEHLFETAGLILFIGAILSIFLIGLVLIPIAWIIVAIAFFSIKVPAQQYAYSPQQTAAPPTHATRFCPNCGAPVDQNATFCPHCGKQLPPA